MVNFLEHHIKASKGITEITDKLKNITNMNNKNLNENKSSFKESDKLRDIEYPVSLSWRI